MEGTAYGLDKMGSVKNMTILWHGVGGQTAPSLSANQHLLYRHLLALIDRLALCLIITTVALYTGQFASGFRRRLYLH